MGKLILLSVVIMMFTIPLLTGRGRNSSLAIRKMLILAFLFNVFYYFALRYIYPRLL